ncbi:hypothetical protein [Actinoplanes sp. NPDC026623]
MADSKSAEVKYLHGREQTVIEAKGNRQEAIRLLRLHGYLR